MSDIEKALAMIAPSAFYEINPENVSILVNAFKAAIKQHQVFRQEVSDELIKQGFINASTGIGRFIIPAPKPDPLVAVISEIEDGTYGETKAEYAAKLRDALEARGLEIREKNDD